MYITTFPLNCNKIFKSFLEKAKEPAKTYVKNKNINNKSCTKGKKRTQYTHTHPQNKQTNKLMC